MNKRFFVKVLSAVICVCVISVCVTSCSDNSNVMKDGYYTAEVAAFDDFGWKEFITIYVSDNQIITVEYDAKNASGFIKSWDMNYMRVMNAADNTYPNEYTRIYSETFLNHQSISGVDVVAGATHSYDTFCLLAEAVVEQAKTGDKSVALVEIPQ